MKEENSYGYVQSFINFVNRNQILKILQIYVAHAVKHAIMTINCNRGSGISPFTSKTMVKAPPEIHSHVVCNHRSHANICSNFRLGASHFCYNPNFPTFSLTPTAPYSTSHLKASVQPPPPTPGKQTPSSLPNQTNFTGRRGARKVRKKGETEKKEGGKDGRMEGMK